MFYIAMYLMNLLHMEKLIITYDAHVNRIHLLVYTLKHEHSFLYLFGGRLGPVVIPLAYQVEGPSRGAAWPDLKLVDFIL